MLAWFGDSNLEMRERGWYDGLSIPRQDLWSRTNCSVVTASFSQFNIVASSMLPRLTDAHDVMNIVNNMGKNFILMFLL